MYCSHFVSSITYNFITIYDKHELKLIWLEKSYSYKASEREVIIVMKNLDGFSLANHT